MISFLMSLDLTGYTSIFDEKYLTIREITFGAKFDEF